MIPDRVLSANIDACCEAAELAPGDVMVSWLPLYHDMGLVGFLALPMTKGVDLVQAAPQDFLAHPGNWMQWLSDYRGTATAGPNFSWVLATRALKRMHDLDLSRLTLALSGAEPVDPARGRRVRGRGVTVRVPPRQRVPGVRDGRGGHRGRVPSPRPGAAHRCGRPVRARNAACRQAGRSRCRRSRTCPCGRCRCSARRCPAWR